MIRTVLLFILLIGVGNIFAQSTHDFYSISQQTNKIGMYVLGTWALTNIATGAYGWNRYDGSQKYFYQMNLMWNVVNLGIAGYAMYSFSQSDPLTMTASEMLSDHLSKENLFLINAGLDVLYMSGGFYMRHLARQGHKRAEMIKGYGNSVILQGGFLMAFDLVMYFIQRQHRLSYDPGIFSLNLGLTPDGIGMVIGL
ncbi:MAG: hypothetical protein IH597_02060 [Bacteroidales bacterium]|nr:hypothetical protein [Bacteroidales bacterium]